MQSPLILGKDVIQPEGSGQWALRWHTFSRGTGCPRGVPSRPGDAFLEKPGLYPCFGDSTHPAVFLDVWHHSRWEVRPRSWPPTCHSAQQECRLSSPWPPDACGQESPVSAALQTEATAAWAPRQIQIFAKRPKAFLVLNGRFQNEDLMAPGVRGRSACPPPT